MPAPVFPVARSRGPLAVTCVLSYAEASGRMQRIRRAAFPDRPCSCAVAHVLMPLAAVGIVGFGHECWGVPPCRCATIFVRRLMTKHLGTSSTVNGLP